MVAKAEMMSEVQAMCTVWSGHFFWQGLSQGATGSKWQVLSVQRREPNDESNPTAVTEWHNFTDADLRYADKLDDKQGGDTIVTMERVREAIALQVQCGVGRRVNMAVAHIGANGLSLETNRRGVARGESSGFKWQPKRA